MKPGKRISEGFTLVEVIIVLMLISIMSAVILHYDRSRQIDLISEADLVKSHVRYVRNLAMNMDEPEWRLVFSGSAYTLMKSASGPSFPLPGEDSVSHKLPDGLAVTVPTPALVFDEWGAVIGGAGDYTVKISVSGSVPEESRSFTIIQKTGCIQ